MTLHITETDLTTGETVTRPMTSGEEKAFREHNPEWTLETPPDPAAEAAAAKKAATLAALAAAAGLDPDDVAQALGV